MPKCLKSGLCAIPLILVMSASSSGQHAGGLTGDERAIVQHIDAHVGDAMKLLEQVVNINSGTQNFRGVQNVGRVLAPSSSGLASTSAGWTGRRSSGPVTSSASIRPRDRSCS